jgi:hypothetical protein
MDLFCWDGMIDVGSRKNTQDRSECEGEKVEGGGRPQSWTVAASLSPIGMKEGILDIGGCDAKANTPHFLD